MKFFKRKSKGNNSENSEAKDSEKQSIETEAAAGAGTPNAGGQAPPPSGTGTGLTPKRIVIGVLGVLALLWIVGAIVGFFEPPTSSHVARNDNINSFLNRNESIPDHSEAEDTQATAGSENETRSTPAGAAPASSDTPTSVKNREISSSSTKTSSSETAHSSDSDSHSSSATDTESHGTPTKSADSGKAEPDSHESGKAKEAGDSSEKTSSGTHGAETTTLHGEKPEKPRRPGIATTEAIIEPLAYELEERWWGWRCNDLINVTDNVNYFQLGVLEVTRRAVVALAERLARTGSTASYDPNLENAMNWFMVKADAYWFPSAESKYQEGLDELRAYKARLERGEGLFFTRPDNLIPLLASFEDLLGSCDENLVKKKEDDGTNVGFTRADDYFYYSQGVAHSMVKILEAVHEDFHTTLETRRSAEILHHAIVACQQATEIDPWLILESDYNSIFANHRAHMAAPISHARFYLGLLIKALST